MAVRVLGAAWGRTGTLSVKLALEMLGLGPCYHMLEVFRVHSEHKATWIEAARGAPVDWDELFGEYQSAVDWPACAFWPELVEEYPEMVSCSSFVIRNVGTRVSTQPSERASRPRGQRPRTSSQR